MVGSRRFFRYIDDLGVAWALMRDEELTEAVNAVADVTPPTVGTRTISTDVVPRTLRYNRSDSLGSKTVVLLQNTVAALEAAPTVISINDGDGVLSYYLTSYIGERQRFVTAIDTAQQDGDGELAAGGP